MKDLSINCDGIDEAATLLLRCGISWETNSYANVQESVDMTTQKSVETMDVLQLAT